MAWDIDPQDIDPDTGLPYSNYSSPSLDTSFHDGEMDVDDAIDPWVLRQWEKMGLTHSVELPDGTVIEHLSQETVDVYVEHRNAEQLA